MRRALCGGHDLAGLLGGHLPVYGLACTLSILLLLRVKRLLITVEGPEWMGLDQPRDI